MIANTFPKSIQALKMTDKGSSTMSFIMEGMHWEAT